METIQQEINIHKSKLFNLINNLVNTQLIDDEISINNDIKTESECLKSLLNIKQNNPMNNVNQNSSFNENPFIFQPNLFNNQLMMNINPMIQNNFNSFPVYNDVKINVEFFHQSGLRRIIIGESNTKISDLIKEYRKRASDYKDNFFIWNGKILDAFSSSTLEEIGISNLQRIFVEPMGNLKGKNQ